MSTPKRAFDPLASLFDLPAAGEGSRAGKAPPPKPPAEGDDVPVPTHVPRPAQSAPPAPPAGPSPAELAKILARAAAAKAAGAKTSPAPARPAPTGKAAAKSPPAPAPTAAASRLGAAPPPRRALSLDEALAAARLEEGARTVATATPPAAAARPAPAAAPAGSPAAPAGAPAGSPAAPAAGARPLTSLRPDQLADVVAAHISGAVPEIGAVYIANALLMDDRVILTALWKAHRARFAHAGQVDAAVACTMVIRALGSVAAGQLAAAHAVTDSTDWLVWVDIDRGPVAAFRDARALFSGSV